MKLNRTLSVLLMLAVCLLFYSINTKTYTGEKSKDGKTISKITIEYEGLAPQTGYFPILKTCEGRALNSEDLNYDIVTLYSTGNFEDIRIIYEYDDKGSIELIFKLKTASFIHDVSFEGDLEFSDDLLQEQAGITFMDRYNQTAAEEGKRRILAYYKNEGFLDASATYLYKHQSGTNYGELIYTITEGLPSKIEKIVIENPARTENSSLNAVPNIEGLRSFIGVRYSRSEINDWLDKARSYLWDNGYLTTEISISDEIFNEAGRKVTLVVKIVTDGVVSTSFNEKDIDSETFKTLLEGKTRRKLSQDIQLEWSNIIQDYYKKLGYPEAKVYTTLFTQDRFDPIFGLNKKSIQFLIRKEKLKKIGIVDFTGAGSFSKIELLQLLAPEKDIRSGKILFATDRIEQWSETISSFYRSKGYLDVKIAEYQTQERVLKNEVFVDITFKIDEGKLSRIKEILISGDSSLNKTEILKIISIDVGDPFIPVSLERIQTSISDYFYKQYNKETDIKTNVYKDGVGDAYIEIEVRGVENEVVEQILLSGNFQTDSGYILSNIDIKEGDPLTRSSLLSAQLKLYDLGLFSNVEFAPSTADILASRKRVLLKVRESLPMLLTYGGGFDTENLIRGTFSLSHNNLGGTGKKADFSLSLGSKESSAQLNYQAPRLIEDKWDFFASVFYEQHQKESFGVTRLGAVLQLSSKMTANMTYLLSFNVENVDLFDVKVSEYLIPPEERAVNLTSFSSTMVIDYRNDPFNPKDGFFISSSLKWANGLLGSNENFLKGYFQGSFYFPVIEDVVIALGFRLGVSWVFGGNEFLPPSERFFAGGSNTLRAYSLDSVGPKDEETGYPLGGNAMLISNAELRIPLFGSLGIVLFYDVGSVFSHSEDISIEDLSKAVGIGLRFNTPIGPLRMDWGINPSNFDQNQFFVSIGHTF